MFFGGGGGIGFFIVGFVVISSGGLIFVFVGIGSFFGCGFVIMGFGGGFRGIGVGFFGRIVVGGGVFVLEFLEVLIVRE